MKFTNEIYMKKNLFFEIIISDCKVKFCNENDLAIQTVALKTWRL